MTPHATADPFARDVDSLRGLRIFFGHHAVGRDILTGLTDLLRARARGGALHVGAAPVGRSGDPLGKIAGFEERVLDADSDIALMKLGFADLRPETNVDALVATYVRTVTRLRLARPGIVVVHTTPPLRARPNDLRARVARAVGRLVPEDAANRRRLELAEGLLRAFPRDPFFDLSRVESTRPDGSRELFLVDGRMVPMLWPGYTTDGAHLNAAGRRAAARAFVRAVTLASTRVPRRGAGDARAASSPPPAG